MTPKIRMTALACVVILSVGRLASATPVIKDWSSKGGHPSNKASAKDTMYLVKVGDKITFSVTAEGVQKYIWQVNKEVQAKTTGDTLTWTVPNKKAIWEIHLAVTGGKEEALRQGSGQAHQEWVVSTLKKSEAPDIFDYFTDKKTRDRIETDPWGRAHPNWTTRKGAGMSAPKGFVESNVERRAGSKIPSSIAYGTWKFRYYFQNSASGYGGASLSPFARGDAYFGWADELGGAHHHSGWWKIPGREDYSAEYDDCGPAGSGEMGFWWEITLIRTKDNFIYAFYNRTGDGKGEMFDFYVHEPLNLDWDSLYAAVRGEREGDKAYFDMLEVYKDKYFFPKKEIRYGKYVTKEVASGYFLFPQYENGIIVKGRNANGKGITLSDISNAIKNPALFKYDPATKTAVCYTNLYVHEGTELLIKDATLKFHCRSDGALKFAAGHGASVIIDKATVTTDTKHYFVWDFANPTTHLGRQVPMYYAWPAMQKQSKPMRYGPCTLEWSYYGRFIVKDSVINNSAHLYLDSPYELSITNTKITNLRGVDIGNYKSCSDGFTQHIRSEMKGNKSFLIQTDDLNVRDFTLRNVTISGENLNITFLVNAHRDKMNVYDIDMQNANVVIKNPLAQTARQSHGAYFGGSKGPWGNVYRWKSYIAGEIGLVNCRFKDVVISPGIFTDAQKRKISKAALAKYYLDVKVVDSTGKPVRGAKVTVAGEQDWTKQDRKTNHHLVENMEITRPYATGKYRCVYHHYRFIDGQPMSSSLTGADGHTPPPSDKKHTFVIADYKKYLDTGTGKIKQKNFTYKITVEAGGKKKVITGVNPGPGWYRPDANKPTCTITAVLDG